MDDDAAVVEEEQRSLRYFHGLNLYHAVWMQADYPLTVSDLKRWRDGYSWYWAPLRLPYIKFSNVNLYFDKRNKWQLAQAAFAHARAIVKDEWYLMATTFPRLDESERCDFYTNSNPYYTGMNVPSTAEVLDVHFENYSNSGVSTGTYCLEFTALNRDWPLAWDGHPIGFWSCWSNGESSYEFTRKVVAGLKRLAVIHSAPRFMMTSLRQLVDFEDALGERTIPLELLWLIATFMGGEVPIAWFKTVALPHARRKARLKTMS